MIRSQCPCERALAALGTALILPLVATTAIAQRDVPEDWTCQFCPLPTGTMTNWSLGSGFVSDESGKFGDYTGFNDEGFYLLADGELRYWGDTGSYWELLLADLGLDSRSIGLDGGRPGVYRLQVSYDELPKYRIDDAVTPYLGVGTASLSLPNSWVHAGSTAAMTGLGQNLNALDVDLQRTSLGAGFAWLAGGEFDYRVDYRREERTGSQVLSGSFASMSAWLPAPVDYVTDEFELAASRSWARGGLEVAFLGSEFTNRHLGLTWENPYTPLVSGADAGRLALAPDNSAEQFRVSGNYRLGSSTHLTGAYATARLEQDDVLLGLSVNPAFATVALPRASLAAKVATEHLNVALVSQLASRLRIIARYVRDERDNETTRAVFDTVLTDLVSAGSRMNIPYGFERSQTSVQGDYRLPRRMRLKGGVERDVHQRTFQARARSEEDSVWASLGVRTLDWLQATIGVEDRSRTGSDYRQVDLGVNLQNPLMRQYHLADREQRVADLDLTLIPHERVSVLLRVESTRDRYPASLLGLTQGNSSFASFDATTQLPGSWDIYASWGRQDVEFDQAGSQSFASPDWYATTEDSTKTRSLGFTKALADERTRVTLDFMDSHSRGMTQMLVGIPRVPFPDYTTRLKGLSLVLDYAINDALAVRAGYRYERYSSADWQLDGVLPATIGNVLTIGAASPQYDIDMLTLSFSYSPRRDQSQP